MVEAANLLQVVFSGEQTHTGSNLHWSQSFKLSVYWDIHYRLSDLYPPITKIILFPLDGEILYRHGLRLILIARIDHGRHKRASIAHSKSTH